MDKRDSTAASAPFSSPTEVSVEAPNEGMGMEVVAGGWEVLAKVLKELEEDPKRVSSRDVGRESLNLGLSVSTTASLSSNILAKSGVGCGFD